MDVTRRTFLATVPMAAILGLAACSSTASSSSKSTAKSGGSIIYAVTEPDSLIPGRQLGAFDQAAAVFAPLTYIDPAGKLTYLQAESVDSSDQKTWTVKLRDGWTFHNGEKVTAKSFVDAWNYTAYGPNAWENSGELAKIVGYTDLNPATGKPTTKEMSGLKVVDDLTFTITLVGPDSQFPLQLSQSQTGFFAMPAAAYDDINAYNTKPIGNGPFKMAGAWKANTAYDVVRYKDYKGTPAILDRITFKPYTDADTAYTDVQAGQADLTFCPTDKMTSASADFGKQLYPNKAPSMDYIGFPLWDRRYSDPRVRKAISMAIDRKTVNKAIYGGLYEPASAFTPPAEAGTPTGITSDATDFDAAGAKKLLAEAGGFDGTIEFVYPGGLGYDSLFQAYANQVRQNLGVPSTAKATTDWSSFQDQIAKKTIAGPYRAHWGALYSSQQNTLRSLFTTAGTGNMFAAGYHDDTIDELLDKADAAKSQDEVIAFYKQVQQKLAEDFPMAPTFFSRYVYVTSAKITKMPSAIGAVVLNETKVSA